MDYKLKNKTAFISGSTSGIGFAIAKLLVGEGVNVIINGRSKEGIDIAVNSIKSIFPKANIRGLVADFSDLNSIKQLIRQLPDVDILINNVGIFSSQKFEDTSDEEWQRLFEVNVMSGVRLSRYLLPEMIKNDWGRIVFISSECAQLVPEDLIAYSTTKAALLSISRGLAQTTKGTGVTVNTVLPGSTLSQGAERFLKEQAEKEQVPEKTIADNFFKDVRTTSLVERFLSPEEIANTVVYLSSPLSSATNGAVITVDGGSVPGIF